MIDKNKISQEIQNIIKNTTVSIEERDSELLILIGYTSDNTIDKDIKVKISNTIRSILPNADYNFKIAYVSKNPTMQCDEPISEKKIPHTQQNTKIKHKIPNIKKIILIASGKGGVGKSTISANTAVALAQLGWKVGLLDADIYGASIPTIFDIQNHEVDINEKTMMIPHEVHGVKMNSIEFITKNNEALIWRGPMISKVLEQLIKNTDWGELDYLIIDTPPGTGDIHITLLENYQIDGFVLVSTPHQISINNTNKTRKMFDKFNIPNLACVINMAWIKNDDENSILQKQQMFNSADISILECKARVIEIPFITNSLYNLFALNTNDSQFFVEICRNIVKETK
jgi:Mrp family chromosome partitioning ATPase